jgi:hypothetical protein
VGYIGFLKVAEQVVGLEEEFQVLLKGFLNPYDTSPLNFLWVIITNLPKCKNLFIFLPSYFAFCILIIIYVKIKKRVTKKWYIMPLFRRNYLILTIFLIGIGLFLGIALPLDSNAIVVK